MTRNQAFEAMRQAFAVWPDTDLPDETVELWIGLLEALDLEVGAYALEDCTRTCRRFPSIAEFTQSARRGYLHLRTVERDVPALPAPAGDRDRVHAIIASGKAARGEPTGKQLLANELDRAGIVNWKERLASARRSGGEAFDREWRAVKEQYAEAMRAKEIA